MNILVIEDDQAIRDMICLSLSQANFYTSGCVDVKCAKKTIPELKPDCLIVDWMLPDGSGIDLIRWLRRQEKFKHIPTLMLTARAEESDKITGLDSGADDYMTKPLSLRELQSRIKALLRRSVSYSDSTHLLQSGPVSMNTENHEVFLNSKPLDLTKTEYLLLKFFITHENRVFSRDQILNAVWGINSYLGDRTVDVHILRLRKLLKMHNLEKMIKTIRGTGYKFNSKHP